MLNDIHNHWKDAEAIRIKCMGVPTIDMENVLTQLEVCFLLRIIRVTTTGINYGVSLL